MIAGKQKVRNWGHSERCGWYGWDKVKGHTILFLVCTWMKSPVEELRGQWKGPMHGSSSSPMPSVGVQVSSWTWGQCQGRQQHSLTAPPTETAEWQAGCSLACFLPLALTMSWERGKCLTGPERAVKTIPEGVSPQANFLLPSQTEKLPGLALSIGTAPHIYLQAPRLSL